MQRPNAKRRGLLVARLAAVFKGLDSEEIDRMVDEAKNLAGVEPPKRDTDHSYVGHDPSWPWGGNDSHSGG